MILQLTFGSSGKNYDTKAPLKTGLVQSGNYDHYGLQKNGSRPAAAHSPAQKRGYNPNKTHFEDGDDVLAMQLMLEERAAVEENDRAFAQQLEKEYKEADARDA
ncbi:hypothetical protein H0H92_008752 [Tricholoma furcatifolium]|nr:hypothetical protein H0H92_008752 [Tricholoma furcatifolium]